MMHEQSLSDAPPPPPPPPPLDLVSVSTAFCQKSKYRGAVCFKACLLVQMTFLMSGIQMAGILGMRDVTAHRSVRSPCYQKLGIPPRWQLRARRRHSSVEAKQMVFVVELTILTTIHGSRTVSSAQHGLWLGCQGTLSRLNLR